MKTILNAKTDIPLLVLSLVMALSSFSGIFSLPSYVFLICVVVFFLLYILPSAKRLRIGSKYLMFFLLISLLSIIINQPPYYFRAWERFLAFLLVLLSFSPLISNESIFMQRMRLFEALFLIIVFMSSASFFAYFLGINYFKRDGVILDYTDAGHFSGLMNHSMMLAPIASLACVYCLASTFRFWKELLKRVLWLCLTMICFGSVLLSGSRGATGAVFFACMIMLYRFNSGKISKTLSYLLIIVSLFAATASIWSSIANPVIEKINANEEQGSLFYSREAKMAARLYEIQNNLFTGVGFCVVDESVDTVDMDKGTIEPNSSWLAVFSMTGVFGFVCFLVFFFKLLIGVFTRIDDKYLSTLMAGLLSFFLIHLLTEGYLLAAGSVLCGLFWFCTGVAYGLIDKEKNNLLKKQKLLYR